MLPFVGVLKDFRGFGAERLYLQRCRIQRVNSEFAANCGQHLRKVEVDFCIEVKCPVQNFAGEMLETSSDLVVDIPHC